MSNTARLNGCTRLARTWKCLPAARARDGTYGATKLKARWRSPHVRPPGRRQSGAASRSLAAFGGGVKFRLPGDSPNKYGARRATVDGWDFDSRAEAARYADLKLLAGQGMITGLRGNPGSHVVTQGVSDGTN